jgi:hypothetical protein
VSLPLTKFLLDFNLYVYGFETNKDIVKILENSTHELGALVKLSSDLANAKISNKVKQLL